MSAAAAAGFCPPAAGSRQTWGRRGGAGPRLTHLRSGGEPRGKSSPMNIVCRNIPASRTVTASNMFSIQLVLKHRNNLPFVSQVWLDRLYIGPTRQMRLRPGGGNVHCAPQQERSCGIQTSSLSSSYTPLPLTFGHHHANTDSQR